jgi:peroxiredoxin Q/BCP
MVAVALCAVMVATLGAAEKPPAVGDDAREFELNNVGGTSAKLSTFTTAGKVVLVVLRGFPGYQCPFCTKQFADFMSKADDFKKADATVIFVYPGPSDDLKTHADDFIKGRTLPDNFHFLLDPDYTFTNAYGLRWDKKKETAYPSTFVIDEKSKVTFAKVSKTHSDRTKAADLLKVINTK